MECEFEDLRYEMMLNEYNRYSNTRMEHDSKCSSKNSDRKVLQEAKEKALTMIKSKCVQKNHKSKKSLF